MNLDYSAEQTLFADGIGRFLDKDYDFERRRHIVSSGQWGDAAIWQSLVDLGCAGLPIAEDVGGFGGGMIEIGLMMRALGAHLVVEPVLHGPVVAGPLLAALADPDVRAPLIESLVMGTARFALASGKDVVAAQTGGVWALHGQVRSVAGGLDAHYYLVPASEGAGTRHLFLVDGSATGLTATPIRLLNAEMAVDLRFDDVQAHILPLTVALDVALRAAEDRRLFGLCWDSIGSMVQAFEASTAYVRDRRQFGQPLAGFQVVQHKIAEMAVACQEAQAAALFAALTLEACGAGARSARALAAAIVRIVDGARMVAEQAVQLHGGMGVSDELSIASHFRKLLAFEALVGGRDRHVARYARQVVATGLHHDSAVLVNAA